MNDFESQSAKSGPDARAKMDDIRDDFRDIKSDIDSVRKDAGKLKDDAIQMTSHAVREGIHEVKKYESQAVNWVKNHPIAATMIAVGIGALASRILTIRR